MIRAQPGSAPVVAERALQWVMCSIRPLNSKQLVAAVCQDPESDDVRPVDVNLDFILHACRNLLVVDARLNTCGFSHLSVQEYFETRVWTPSQSHAHAAKTCLVLLGAIEPDDDTSASPISIASNHSWRTDDSEADEDDSETNEDDIEALKSYAVGVWPRHVQKHGED
jgi:hypothetical protein